MAQEIVMRVSAGKENPEAVVHSRIPAGIVATAIGLLADFLVLRDGQTRVDLVEFIDWLHSHDHPELGRRIESDSALHAAFQAAFDEGHGDLATRLEFLDEGLILVCGTDGALARIAQTLRPDLAVKVHSR